MDGTVVRLNKDASIKEMISKRNMLNELIDEYYKTVNIYKFSKDFSNNVYIPFLETYQKVVGKNSYYESVLSCLLSIGSIKLQAFNMSEIDWYEIDDEQDLDIADTMFSKGIDKYNKLLSKWGGYWRYGILDAALLVNPYFPTKEMNEKIVRNYETLLTQYPSCLSIQNLNAARVFDVDKEKIIVGNGASELIYALGRVFENKKVAVCSPVFNEYLRCFSKSKITVINNRKTNFEFNYDAFIDVLYSVDCVSIVSPDNPTGIHIERAKMIDMLSKAKEKNVKIILDESFIDFADQNERQSFISNEILDNFDNLIVVKSISKSHGNPGIRLGVLATSDVKLIKSLEKNISIWNINSFAEYYLQIFNLYKKEYYESCNKIAIERNRISKKYSYYKNLRVYKSQANYILLEFLEHNSKQIALKMLENDNILIKDLSPKDAFKGINCVRIAVKSREENDLIMNAILKYTNNINNETI